jgi:hypothetical protein
MRLPHPLLAAAARNGSAAQLDSAHSHGAILAQWAGLLLTIVSLALAAAKLALYGLRAAVQRKAFAYRWVVHVRFTHRCVAGTSLARQRAESPAACTCDGPRTKPTRGAPPSCPFVARSAISASVSCPQALSQP